MGKSRKTRNLILLSGFKLNDNNRGSAALGYGSIDFLLEKGFAKENDSFCLLNRLGKKIWKWRFPACTNLRVGNKLIEIKTFTCLNIEYKCYNKLGFFLPFTPFGKMIRGLKLVAATNGGDGLSDIYGISLFRRRLIESRLAILLNLPLIELPQTIGPFTNSSIKMEARDILQYASHIYIRDYKFKTDLQEMGLKYEKERDLSYYMEPEKWDVDVEKDAIGINVSGLAYYNNFRTLAGKFDIYHQLIIAIIESFQAIKKPIYLIPHSYNYHKPEPNNDDLEACRDVFLNLKDRTNVSVIDRDMTAPQVKYLISQMNFFIGTRMHSNFAAIYTGVPVFGLSYSYKFSGAFEANGLANQTYNIINLREEDVDNVVNKIMIVYNKNDHEKNL